MQLRSKHAVCTEPAPPLHPHPPPPPRERGKLWDPSSKERWGHDAFEALERGEQPTSDDWTEVWRGVAGWLAGWLS